MQKYILTFSLDIYHCPVTLINVELDNLFFERIGVLVKLLYIKYSLYIRIML